MATITITIPDASVTRVQDAIATKYGYTVADGTKAEFLVATLRNWLKMTVCDVEVQTAVGTAADTAEAEIIALIA